MDASLDVITSTATAMNLCDAAPIDFTAATTLAPTGDMLATAAITSGDWTKADASSGTGREIKVGQKSTTVGATGTATHIAFVSGTVLLATVEVISQGVTVGNPIQYPATDSQIIFNRELATF